MNSLRNWGCSILAKHKALAGSDQEQEIIDYISWVSRIGIEAHERPMIEAALADAVQMAEAVSGQAAAFDPVISVSRGQNHFRKGDTARPSAFVQSGDLFKNAPSVKGDYFKVANILE